WQAEHAAAHHYCGARECCNGVDVAAQHRGHFVRQHVAQHATPDTGQHPEDDCREGPELEVERLERARHGEEGEATGVENEHRAAHAIDHRVPAEGDQSCKDRHCYVAPVRD